jgi:anti-sigma regulatory factor (Ser/Thr protein kinase)
VLALELAVSELVSNAVVHGEGTIEVELTSDDEEVRLAVADAGGGQPVLRPATTPDARVGGWGLGLVDELADDWGTANDEAGTRVWVVRRTAPPGAESPVHDRPGDGVPPRVNGRPGPSADITRGR